MYKGFCGSTLPHLFDCIIVLRTKFEKTFSALKINVQTLYMHPFTFFHILKDPKSLTSKPNCPGSMIILTYICSRVDYMVWNNYHSICNTFSNLSKIVDKVSLDKQVPTQQTGIQVYCKK